MSVCHFDYFQEGRSDVLKEMRIERHHGQWTKERRARWMREAVSSCECLKHANPDQSQAISYYAGRISALKSALTADFFKPVAATSNTRQLVQVKKYAIALGSFILPVACLVGFRLSNVVWPEYQAGFVELLIVVGIWWQSRNLVRLLFFFIQKASDRRKEQ